jgi:hypothetical protein
MRTARLSLACSTTGWNRSGTAVDGASGAIGDYLPAPNRHSSERLKDVRRSLMSSPPAPIVTRPLPRLGTHLPTSSRRHEAVAQEVKARSPEHLALDPLTLHRAGTPADQGYSALEGLF